MAQGGGTWLTLAAELFKVAEFVNFSILKMKFSRILLTVSQPGSIIAVHFIKISLSYTLFLF